MKKYNIYQHIAKLSEETARNKYWVLFVHSKSHLEAKKINKKEVCKY